MQNSNFLKEFEQAKRGIKFVPLRVVPIDSTARSISGFVPHDDIVTTYLLLLLISSMSHLKHGKLHKGRTFFPKNDI